MLAQASLRPCIAPYLPREGPETFTGFGEHGNSLDYKNLSTSRGAGNSGVVPERSLRNSIFIV